MQMRSILMIVILALCLTGCKEDNDGGADVESTTLKRKGSHTSLPPSQELVVVVKDTPHPDYQEYHKQWNLLHSDLKPAKYIPPIEEVPHEIVELYLDDLTFREAFDIEYRAKGEGHTFWWRGTQYTTDLKN